jgi:malate dehydrogenase (oxaloacetate-decarboxylating)
MAKNGTGAKALALHKKLRGKIRIQPALEIKDRTDLSLIYTPGVASVSSAVAKNNKLARSHTIKGRMVAVISDGSAVLGLGNIGALGALPVMEGKCALFKKFAGVDAFPIVLATQEPEEIVETIVRIAPAFGGINLEDIAAPKCFYIDSELKKRLDIPVFHDDQHGTAVAVLAALYNAARVVKKDFKKLKIVIAGAGAAGTAVSKLLHKAGAAHTILLDRNGIVSKHRRDLSPHKKALLKPSPSLG